MPRTKTKADGKAGIPERKSLRKRKCTHIDNVRASTAVIKLSKVDTSHIKELNNEQATGSTRRSAAVVKCYKEESDGSIGESVGSIPQPKSKSKRNTMRSRATRAADKKVSDEVKAANASSDDSPPSRKPSRKAKVSSAAVKRKSRSTGKSAKMQESSDSDSESDFELPSPRKRKNFTVKAKKELKPTKSKAKKLTDEKSSSKEATKPARIHEAASTSAATKNNLSSSDESGDDWEEVEGRSLLVALGLLQVV